MGQGLAAAAKGHAGSAQALLLLRLAANTLRQRGGALALSSACATMPASSMWYTAG
jgi:hypothetical protein